VSATETALTTRIKGRDLTINKKEGGMVGLVIEQGRDYAALKGVVKKYRWSKVLKGLKQDPRTVDRYLRIGGSWWGGEPTDSPFWANLPYDLLKLEWLCRLSQDQLKELLKYVDCRKASRSVLISTVKRTLGQPETDARKAHTTAQAIAKRWIGYVTRTLEAIDELADTDADREVLHELAEELEAGYADIKESLTLQEACPEGQLEGGEADGQESADLEDVDGLDGDEVPEEEDLQEEDLHEEDDLEEEEDTEGDSEEAATATRPGRRTLSR